MMIEKEDIYNEQGHSYFAERLIMKLSEKSLVEC